MEARRLIASMIASLKFSGWDLAGTLDISRQLEVDIMMFRLIVALYVILGQDSVYIQAVQIHIWASEGWSSVPNGGLGLSQFPGS